MSLDNTNPTTATTTDQLEAAKKAGTGDAAAAALHNALGSVQSQIDVAGKSDQQKAAAAGKYVLPMSIDGAAATPKALAAPGDVVSRNAATEAPTDATTAKSKAEKLPDGGTSQVVDGSTVTSDKWGRVTSIQDSQHQTTSFKYADKTSKSQPDTLVSYTDSKGSTLSRPDATSDHWTTADGKHFDGSIAATKSGTTFSDSQTGAQTTLNTDGSRKTVYGDKLEVDQDATGKPTKVVDTNGKVVDAKNISTDGTNVSFSRNDGAVVQIAPDGSRNTQNADGSSVQTNDAQKVTSVTTASGSNTQFDYDKSGNLSGFKNEQGWWQSADGGKTYTNSTEDPTTKKVTNTSITGSASVDAQGNFTIASAKQPGDVQAASKTIHTDGSQTQANTDGSNLTVKPDGSSITQSASGDISVTNANKQQYQFQFQHDASGNIETDASGNKKLASVTNANGNWQAQPDGKTWTNTDPKATAENKTWSGTMSVNSAGDYSYTPSDTNVKTTLKADGTSVQQNLDGSQVATDKAGQISRSVDASGHVTTFGHDATSGALNKITTDAGSWSTADGTNWSNGSAVWSGAIAVNNSTGDISYKDSTKTQTAKLDGTGSVSNSDGSNVNLNQQGKISTVQDGAHHTFSYGYQPDATGQQALTSAQTPDGTYSSKDGGKTFTGPDGKPAQVKLDSSGNLNVSDSAKSTLYQTDGSKVTSDSSSRVTNVVDASGRQSTYQYAGSSNNVTAATINDSVTGKSTSYTSTDGGATLSDGKHTVNSMQVDKQGNLSYTESSGALRNNYSDGTSFNIKADGGSYATDSKGQLTDAVTANGFNVSLKRASDGSITDAYTSLGHFQQTQKDTWTNTDKPTEVVHGSLSASNDGTLSFTRTDANTVTLKGDQTTVERPDHSSFTKNASGDTVAASTQSVSAAPKNFTYQYSQNATTGKSELSGYNDGTAQWTKSGTDTWTSNTGSSFHGSVSLDKNELPEIAKTDAKTTTTYGVGGGSREVDSSGKLISKEAANGNRESFGYDSTGALSSIKSDSGSWTRGSAGTWSNGTDSFKGSVSVDSHGNQSWVSSDNSVRKSVASDGAEKDYYSAQGQINAVVGKNAAGQVTDSIDGQGKTTQYGYQAGKLSTVSDGQNTWKASADGKSWSLNGDSSQQFHGTVAVDSHGAQTWANSDNGSVRKASADGSQQTNLANGARIESDATGEKTTYTQASTTGKPTQIQVTPDETRITNPTTRTVLSQKSGSDSITLSDSKGNVLSEAHGSITVDNTGNATVVNKDAHSSVTYTNDGKATVNKLSADGADAQRPATLPTTGLEGQRGATVPATGPEGQRGATVPATGLEGQRGATVPATGLEGQRGATVATTGQEGVRGAPSTIEAQRGGNQEGPLSSQGAAGSVLKPTAETVEKGVAAKVPTEPAPVVVGTNRASGEAATVPGALKTAEPAGATLASLNAAGTARLGSVAPVHQDVPVNVAHQPTLSSTVPTGESLFKASIPENTLSVSNIGGQSPLAGGQIGAVVKASGTVSLGSGGPGQKATETYSSSASTVTSAGTEGGTRVRHISSAALDAAFGGGKAEQLRGGADFGSSDGGSTTRRESDNGGGGYGGGRRQDTDGGGGRPDNGNARQNADGGNSRQNADGGNGRQNADGGNGRQNADGGNSRQNADGGNGRQNADGTAPRQDAGTPRQDVVTARQDGQKGEVAAPGGQRGDGVQVAGQKGDGTPLGGQKSDGLQAVGATTLARSDAKLDGAVAQVSGKTEALGGQVVAKLDGAAGTISGKGLGQGETVTGKAPVVGSSETLLKGSVSVDARVTALADGKGVVPTTLEGTARTNPGAVLADGKLASTNPALQTASKDGIITGGATLAAGGKAAIGSELASNKLPNGLERYAVGPGGSTVVAPEKTVALNNTNALAGGQLAKLGFADGAVLLNGGKPGDLHATSLAALSGAKGLDGKGTVGPVDGKATLALNQLETKAGGLDSKIVNLQAQQVASLDASKGRVDVQAVANHQAPQVLAKSDVIGSTVTKAPDVAVRGPVQDLRGTDVGRAPIKDQVGQPIQETKTVATTAVSGGSAAPAAGATAGAAAGAAGVPGHSAPGLASTSANLTGPGQVASGLGAHSPANGASVLSAGLPINGALPGQPGLVTAAGGVPNAPIHGGITNNPGVNASPSSPLGSVSSLPTANASGHGNNLPTNAPGTTLPLGAATGPLGATSLPTVQAGHGTAQPTSFAGTTAPLGAAPLPTAQAGHGNAQPTSFAGTTAPLGAAPLPTAQGGGHSGVNNLPTAGAGVTGQPGNTSALPSAHDPNGSVKSVNNQGQPISLTGGLSVGPNGAPTLNVNVGTNLGNGQPGANLGVAINLGGNNGAGNNGAGNNGAGNNGQFNSAPTKGLPSGSASGSATNLPGGVNYLPPGVTSTQNGSTHLPGTTNAAGGVTNLPGGVTGMPIGAGTTQGVQPGGQANRPGNGPQPVNAQGGLPTTGTININQGSGGINNGVSNIGGAPGNTNAGVINVNGGSNNLNNGVVNVHGGSGNVNAGTINYNNGSGNVNNGTINNLGGSGVTNVGAVNNNGGSGNVNNGSINSVGGQGPVNSGNGATKTGIGNVPSGTISSAPGGTGTVVPGGTSGQAANGSGQISSNPIGVGTKPGSPIATGTGQPTAGTTSGANPLGNSPTGNGQTSPLPVQAKPGQSVSGSSQNPSSTGSGTGGLNTYQPPSQINNAPGGSTVQSNPGQKSGGSYPDQGPTITAGQNPANGSSGVSVTIPISSGIGLTFGETTGSNGKTQGNIGVTIGGVSIGVNTGTGQVSFGEPTGSGGKGSQSGQGGYGSQGGYGNGNQGNQGSQGNIGITVGGVTIGVNTGNGQVSIGGTIGGIIGGLLGLGGGSGYGEPSQGTGSGGILHPGPPGGYPGTGTTGTGTGGAGHPTTGTGSGYGTGTGAGSGTGTGTGAGTGTGTGTGSGSGSGYGTGTGNGTGTGTGSGSGSGYGTGTGTGTNSGGTDSGSTNPGSTSSNPTGGSGSSSGGSDSSTYTGTGDGGNGTGTAGGNPSSGSDPGIPDSISAQNGTLAGDPSSAGTAGAAAGTGADTGAGTGTASSVGGGTNSGTAPLSGTVLYNDDGSGSGAATGSGTGSGNGSATTGSTDPSQASDDSTNSGNAGGTTGTAQGTDSGNYAGTAQNSPDGSVNYNTPTNSADGSAASQGSAAQEAGLNGSSGSTASVGDPSTAQSGLTDATSGATESGATGFDSGAAQSGLTASNSGSPQYGTTGSDSGSPQTGVSNSDSDASQSGVVGSNSGSAQSATTGSETGSTQSATAGSESGPTQAGTAGSESGPTQSGTAGSESGSTQSGMAGSETGSTQAGMAGSDTGSTQSGMTGSDFAPVSFGSDFASSQQGFAGSEITSSQLGSNGPDSNSSQSQAASSDSNSNQSGIAGSDSDSGSTYSPGQFGAAGPDFAAVNNGVGYSAGDGFIPSFDDNGSPSANTNNALADFANGDAAAGAASNSGANPEAHGALSGQSVHSGGGIDPDFVGNIAQDLGNADLTSFAPNSMGNEGGFGGALSSTDFGPSGSTAFDQQQSDQAPFADRRLHGAEGERGSDLTSFTGQSSSDDGFMPGAFSSDFSAPHGHGQHANAINDNAYDGDYTNAGSGLDDGNRTAHNNGGNPDQANFDGGWGNTAAGFAGELGNLINFDDGRPQQNDVPLDGSASGGTPFGNDDLAGRSDGVYDYRHEDRHTGYDDGISYGESGEHHHKHRGDAWSGDLSDTGMTAPDGREFGQFGEEGGSHQHRLEQGLGWLDSDSDKAANRVDSDLIAQTASNDDSLLDAAIRQTRIEDDEARLKQDRFDLQNRLDRERQLKQEQDVLKAEEALKAALKLQQEQQSKEDEATRLLALIASAQEEEKREDNKQELYRVQSGDTLERIALAKFQDPSIAPLIFELNKSKIEMQVSGTRVAYRLKEGSLLTLPSRRQIREFKQRQLTAAAQGLDVFGQPLTTNAKRLLDESQQRRLNVEKMLGQFDPTPTDGRVRVNVRLGDTLRSVAMKHPAVNDVSLWKLLAEVNGLSTDVDAKGTPTSQLRRGTPLIIPSADEIHAYKNRGMNSGVHRPISTPIAARADMTVITGNRSPQSLNIKAENLDPVEQKWVQETLINSLIEKLGEACRVVKSNDGGENRMMRSQLEVLTGDVWVPIITYEICDTASVRYEIAPDGSRISIPIDLPSSTVEELMSNDLQRNWRSYAKQFLKNRTEAS